MTIRLKVTSKKPPPTISADDSRDGSKGITPRKLRSSTYDNATKYNVVPMRENLAIAFSSSIKAFIPMTFLIPSNGLNRDNFGSTAFMEKINPPIDRADAIAMMMVKTKIGATTSKPSTANLPNIAGNICGENKIRRSKTKPLEKISAKPRKK